MNLQNQSQPSFTLKSNGEAIKVNIKNITHIVCDAYICNVYLHNASEEKITVSRLLKEFESELHQYGFVRINHNILINSYFATSFANGNKRTIKLSNNFEFKVSRRKMNKNTSFSE